jgi:4-carboxymuconolactone decarboxylase
MVPMSAVPPRLGPLSSQEIDEERAALLPRIMVAGTMTTGQSNIMRTLVRHPSIFQRWTPFLDGLLNGTLSDRDRELMVLRTAWNCRCEYAWGQHVVVGRKVGLADEEIRRITEARIDAEWAPNDSLLLGAADELHRDFRVSDATWARLVERYDDQQLIELIMVVGHYQMIAMILLSLAIPADEGLPGFQQSVSVTDRPDQHS